MKTRNILLLVEGKVTEVEVFGRIEELFFDKNTKLKFFAYKSNIYSLYRKIKDYEDFTSTIDVLKEIATTKEDKETLSHKFSEIYLIFDFDPQESAYSDIKIKELVQTFNNETEFGKLYINYPMMESMRDHDNFAIKDFLQRMVSLNGLCSEEYKKYISNNGYKKSLKSMTVRHFKKLSKLNIIKSNYIVCGDAKFPEFDKFEYATEQNRILDKQINEKNTKNEFFVLNTCMFFFVDYFGHKYYDDIKKS